jgi:hypothetical protein
MEAATGASDAEFVTRDELYDRLHARLSNPPRRATPLERNVMAQAAARSAASRHPQLTFTLRPGLVAEMLRFYDLLRRQSQPVKRFEELMEDALGGDDLDRAARRMRVQTRFLADTFREYERLAGGSAACDARSSMKPGTSRAPELNSTMPGTDAGSANAAR